MARTVQESYDYIVTYLVNTFANVGVTITPSLWSQTNNIRLLCWSIAIAQTLEEQLQDKYLADITAIQKKSTPSSKAWIQFQVLKFQYSSTNPQYLVNVGGVFQYANENEALRIIKGCVVHTTPSGVVKIKVAKDSPLVALSAPELSALQNYCNLKFTAGITYVAESIDSDKLYIKATIYYKGVYSSVIQASVIGAVKAYLETLSLNDAGGEVIVSTLINQIKSVDGVNDVVLERVSARSDAQALFGGIDLVLGNDVINRKYIPFAGYTVEETTASNTFQDTLTFIPE
jgi:hypothetical protein